jgi:hypothetical protein
MSDKEKQPSPYSEEKVQDFLEKGGQIYQCEHGESQWLALNERKEAARKLLAKKFGDD